ncbi:UDP-N-acetylmuramoyl-tripeptide--D-alanyl-D-alanine ligase [Desulfatitalea alkaliphila]|uniref:UDP-N-acetylmuramoyl-tripeptide--D-alanyl-D-alanine ligase n=1 Tax=Desulfatitalea alkaliphila TaxID=2929485 RepID=A0AA41R7N4_9BACT|nr:UDP-N-acetylmuramoyl-tripeptide--D-alanyl-D-alanine ligase [Desulfatitalea alkaliphila]MCJ8502615.1 UDP-N-acetylmuramoyl-tripeptide--D-alanyl-D-alanine ligase [Desulfatitalea alkaliphila]
MMFTLPQILQATGGRHVGGPSAGTFAGVGIDSRTIDAARLFVAIRGERHDGHDFVPAVVARGIKGVVVDEVGAARIDAAALQDAGVACVVVADTLRALGALAHHLRLRSAIPVVAITGSNGKTTTRRMTALVLSQQFNTLATQGNFNNEIGLPLTLFNLTAAHQAAVLELGMNHPGEIDRLGAICRPTVGIITTVGPCHLEFLGDLEGVARAKGELIGRIAPEGTAVLNGDDPNVAALAWDCDRRVLFFGTAAECQVRAENIVAAEMGMAFDLALPDERVHVRLATPGRFMVSNALAAAAAGYLLGVPANRIKAGLEQFAPEKGRLQVRTTAGHVHLIDDTYNANPASMQAAIETLSTLRQGRPGIIVVGDMLELGAQAERFHFDLGRQAAASGVFRLYAHGPQAAAVRRGALAAGMAADAVMIGTKEAITEDLLQHLAPEQWVLVKGSRGMVMETVAAAIDRWTTSQAERND